MNKNIFLTLCLMALALTLLTVNKVSASTINFTELSNGGIEVSGDINGASFDVTKASSETFHISSPVVPSGYSPDLVLSRIGISSSASYYLFDLLDAPGGTVSDYIYVHQFTTAYTVIDFFSATSGSPLTLPNVPTATFVETGGLQAAGSYFNDKGELVQFNVLSPAGVPDSGNTMTLLSLALGGLLAVRRKLGLA